MAPDPDQVHVHHGVAAEIAGEEVRTGVAVEREQRQRRGEHRERGHDQDVRAQRGPGEDRHAHHRHARRAHLDDGRDQVDAGQRRAYAGNLQGPQVVVDPHVRAGQQAGQRRIGQPAGLRELADEQRGHHQDGTAGRHPEAEVVQEGEGHVAGADLQRHDIVHEAGHQRHGDEEDHDDAVSREHLVVVVRRQEALAAAGGDGLVRAHQDRIGEAAQQHHQAEHDVHDADLLVVDAGDPVAPQRAPEPVARERREDHQADRGGAHEGGDEDRVVQRDRLPAQAAEQQRFSGRGGIHRSMGSLRVLTRRWSCQKWRACTPSAVPSRQSWARWRANSPTVTTPGHWLISASSAAGSVMARPCTSRIGCPLSVTTPWRGTARPPMASKRRAMRFAAMPITSTGSGKRPRTSTCLEASAMHRKHCARSATIFSRVKAAPPPLIMWPRGSISSAPST
mmetsp:Transcript_21396/g.82956  ORF Transcript_21396/g.82956 Transcript_21396/m.82956 type:complete len:451 (-) Transcript_21396:5165-6517(-)